MHTNNFRLSKKYKIINHGEVYEFSVILFVGEGNFKLKDIHTLEEFYFEDIIKFGRGDDFEIVEL